jgi:hypothetical protein
LTNLEIDFLSCLENLVASCHIRKIQTLWERSLHTHTHTLYELSKLFSLLCLHDNFVYVILVYQLHVYIILTCSLIDFSDRYTCVSYYSCEEPYLVVFPFLQLFQSMLVYFLLCLLNSWTNITLFTLVLLRPLGGVIFIYSWFLLHCFTLCPFVTKGGSNFYSWTGNVFPNRSSDFCPIMAKG